MWLEFSLLFLILSSIPINMSFMDYRYGFKKTLAIAIIYSALIYIMELGILYTFGTKILILTYPLHMFLTAFVFSFWLNKSNMVNNMFAVLSIYYWYYLTGNIVAFVLRNTFDVRLIFDYKSFAMITVFSVFIILTYRYFHIKLIQKGRYRLIFIFLPIFYFVIYEYGAVTFFDGIEKPIFGSGFAMILSLFTLSIYISLFTFISKTENYNKMELENRLLITQIKSLDRQCRILNEVYENNRILRHDIRHIVNNLTALLDNSGTEEAKDYINQVSDKVQPHVVHKYCENTNLNALLSYYIRDYQKEGIEMIVNVVFPKETEFNYGEFTIAFTNALENAYNACRTLPEGINPFIKIDCISSPHFALRISNPTSGNVKFNKEGMPVSSDKYSDNHGLGVISMKNFAKNNGLELFFNVTDGVFEMNMVKYPPLKI